MAGKWAGGRVDSKHASDGKKSIRINNGYCQYIVPDIPPNRSYLLLFDVYAEKPSAEGRLSFKLGYEDNGKVHAWKTNKGLVITPGSWNTYSAVNKLPETGPNKRLLKIRIPIWFTKFEKNELVWFDNVRLYCLDEIQ